MQFGVSIVGFSKTGLIPVISTKLPFLNYIKNSDNSLDTFLYRFSTPIGMLLGQGDLYQTGLFGTYPIPNSNDYIAFSYSFFLPDTILGTPRNDQNAYLIAIFFIPKNLIIDKDSLENLFKDYFNTLSSLDDLVSKENFERLISFLKEKVFSGFDNITPTQDESISPKIQTKIKRKSLANTNERVFINLATEPESIIALPWILHAVYHGLEQATIDILGESNSLLEILMEQYTAEILDRFHLFDEIFNKDQPNVKDALDLGVKHLARVGEYVTVTPIGENKFQCSIKCSFSNAVHPYLPITKCLWMRYLSAMVRRTLPPDKDIKLRNSSFDSEFGSHTIIEIVPKVFKEIKI